MSATWAINGTSLAALGLEFTGGTFNTGTRSVMTLRKTGDFTGVEAFPWGTPVTLTRDGLPFFQGRVNSVPHSATADDESQEFEIVDAWQDLEETIYHEEWPAGASGTVPLPIAILGRKSNGAECTDAEQIVEAVTYAAAAGVNVQMGTIPSGLPLWQCEVRNVSVAEVIRISLRFHPDWVPWIDHTTTPPTLNITPRAGLSVRTIDLGEGDTTSVSMARRDDLKADAVKILYLNAVVVDGTTYRDWIQDKYPAEGPEEGPRVISNIIELAGGQMQFQKQRIKTRPLPENHGECRTWLKRKFPELAEVDDAAWSVRMTERKLIPEPVDDPEADPINERAERLTAEESDGSDVPRELVKGTIEDWMQKKVGKVRIGFEIRINAGAGAAARKKLAHYAAMSGQTVTATNAITKLYKGVTQWVAPESAPTGIAAAVYHSLSAYQHEGSITTVLEDVSGLRYHGTKLNIAGGRSEWGAMNALVHSVSFDIASGTTTIGVGPAPFLAAQDMLELRRLLRGRPVTWMSEEERTSNEMGATNDPGSKGDSVGGYEGPETIVEYLPQWRFPVTYDEGAGRLHVGEGSVAWGDSAQPDSVTRPFIPKLDGTSLSENPSWAAGTSGKEYEVICIYNSSSGRMVLHEKDGDEDLEMESDERARQIATVTFGSGGVTSLVQTWHDDIEHGGEDAGSSGGGSHSGEEESEGESDDDSDGPPDESDDDSDSDSHSGSSSSSGGGACCPTIDIESADVMAIGFHATQDPSDWPSTMAVCYTAPSEQTLIYVNTSVTGASSACAPYKGKLWLVVQAGSSKKSVYLGTAMGGSFTTQHLITAGPLQDIEVSACVEMFGPPVAGLAPIDNCCTLTTTVTTPDSCL